ncbi:hypothetical protein HDV00_006882 [Rhizophlyctis rosea]|nr:hypothetical protein HDV00_006882 [Rhizophlyctis rosea]
MSRPTQMTSPPITPPPGGIPPRTKSRSKGLDETYDELEKMLADMNGPRSPSTPTEAAMNKAEKFYQTGVGFVEKGLGHMNATNGKIAMVKKGYDLVNSATNGELGGAIKNVLSNGAIERAIHIADGLVDLGKTLPFVAPIFTVLKVIIDVEQKARDAASKCEDLLERINFMTSQLLVLKKVKIIDTVQAVVARMEKVLKEAAALIVAYRKQGPIARRLNVGNKDKFIGAKGQIKDVTDDLMLTLQVQHTTQMDILERAVPQDPEDDAAEEFVNQHGGVEAIKNNPALVEAFASQLKLTMDDSVMEELNSNIADMMKEQTEAINHLLQQNVTAAVVDGIKGFATELKAAEDARDRESKKICVQCTEQYRESINTDSACKFHLANHTSTNRGDYPCCGRKEPCKENWHRYEHHCEWPYGTFFTRSMQLLNYTDTVDWYSDIEEKDYEGDGVDQKVGVGKVLRWTSRSNMVTEPVLVIRVGSVWYTQKYFLQTYTPEKIDEINLKGAEDDLIAQIGEGDAWARAEWIKNSVGMLVGVRTIAKVKSSETPTVHEAEIDFDTMEQIGETTVVSEAKLKPFKPIGTYTLPETIHKGAILPKATPRKPRTDFKTRTSSSSLQLVITPSSTPPLVANPQWAYVKCDQFIGTVSIFNKSKSPDPVTIMSVKAQYRLVGDSEYQDVTELEVNDPQNLPVNVDPRQSTTIKFTATVPRAEEDHAKEVRWYNRAFVARHRPLRLKLVFTDVEGEEASVVVEYVYQPFKEDERKDEDLGFFFVDDIDLWNRHVVKVDKDSWGSDVVRVGGKSLTVEELNKIVYGAIKDGNTEVDLGYNHKWDDGVTWNAWALVDLSCKRVYAMKVLMKEERKDGKVGTKGTLGYALVPEYGYDEGKEPEGRRISYAKETVRMPEIEEVVWPEWKDEDGVDDVVPEPPKPAVQESRDVLPGSAPLGVGGVVTMSGPMSLAVPEVLEKQFAGIGASLEKLAKDSGKVPEAVEKRLGSIDRNIEKMAIASEASGDVPAILEQRLKSIDETLGKIADAGQSVPIALEGQLREINRTLGEVARSAAIAGEGANREIVMPAPVAAAAPSGPIVAAFPPELEKQLADLNDNLGAIAMTAIAGTKAPAPAPMSPPPASPAPVSPGLEKQLEKLNRNLENLSLNALVAAPSAVAASSSPTSPTAPSSLPPASNPTFDRRLASIDLNLERIANAMPENALDDRLQNIDNSLSRMADAFDRMVGILGHLAETQNAVEALVGVMGKFADRD